MLSFITKKRVFLLLKILGAALVVFYAVIIAGNHLYFYLEEKKVQAIIDDMERPYLEDTYGGSTPEETFSMFVEALKNDDLELASRYFDIEKQHDWLEYLTAVKSDGRMEELIQDLTSGRLRFKESAYENDKRYQIVNQQEEVVFRSVVFYKYPSGVWKLKTL